MIYQQMLPEILLVLKGGWTNVAANVVVDIGVDKSNMVFEGRQV